MPNYNGAAREPAAATAVLPPIILSHPRDPGMFCGTFNTDAEYWLNIYEGVSVSQ